MRNQIDRCLREKDIELYILNHGVNNSHKTRIERHLKGCHACEQKYSELLYFYYILGDEFERPTSTRVFDFVRDIENFKIDVILLILNPSSDSPKTRPSCFYSQFALKLPKDFDMNGLNGAQMFSTEDNQTILNVIEDQETGETMLFFLTKGKNSSRTTSLVLWI